MHVCGVPNCPVLSDTSGWCQQHQRQADRARGTAAQRGYTSTGHRQFRAAVLAADPVCVVCRQQPATVADHYPLSRKQLLSHGMNPNDPAHGRGVCKRCHDTETAKHQLGGWNA